MNLLELNEKAIQKISNKEKANKELEDYKEIQKIIYEISIGKEKHTTNNKELFNEMKIELKEVETVNLIYIPWAHNNLYKYSFKLNKTNISKIQKYIDKESKDE